MEGAGEGKAALRATMKDRIQAIPPLQRSLEEELVNAYVQGTTTYAAASTLLVYKHKGAEFSAVALTNAAFRDGKRVAMPRVAAPGQLTMHEVCGWVDLVPGAFGLLEPAATAPEVAPGAVDLAIIPGLAWDPGGGRLGQGGGYYDRLLPRLEAPTWGLAFDVQVVKAVPMEAHDVPVDRVIHGTSVTET